MKQIDFTKPKKSQTSPFKVPEGYFERFNAQIIQQVSASEQLHIDTSEALNEETPERITLFTRVKPYLYLAATICGLAFGVKVYKYQQQYFETPQNVAKVSVTTQQAKQYVEDVCDFTMIDEHDVYACATGNY